jgi:hypothetical protein
MVFPLLFPNGEAETFCRAFLSSSVTAHNETHDPVTPRRGLRYRMNRLNQDFMKLITSSKNDFRLLTARCDGYRPL